jgi:LysR family transcriptional regulator, regulator of abg operon
MKLSHLRNAVAVVECGSLRAAARRLKIAQPALTRSIHELESELGVPLFDRRAKGAVATEMGERVILRARTILSEMQHVREDIGQLQGVTEGSVSMCLGVLPHLTLLPSALRAFRSRYPDVKLDVIEGRLVTVAPMLKAGIVDFFVGPLHAAPGKEFTVERLYELEVGILCRKGHPLAGAQSLRELARAEWLTNSVTVEPTEELRPLFARYGLPPPRIVAQSHSALTILAMVGYSDLLTLLPTDLAGTTLGGALLQRIAIAEPIPNAPIVMIRRCAMPLTPAAQYFADMLRRASTERVRAPG